MSVAYRATRRPQVRKGIVKEGRGLGVPLKVGEIWILGESLNGSLRESAAQFSGRDVPTEVGSRNLFPLPSASSAQSAVKAPPRIGNGQSRA